MINVKKEFKLWLGILFLMLAIFFAVSVLQSNEKRTITNVYFNETFNSSHLDLRISQLENRVLFLETHLKDLRISVKDLNSTKADIEKPNSNRDEIIIIGVTN